MHRQSGSPADIVAAVQHVLGETLGEDEAMLIAVPAPQPREGDVDGCNWTMQLQPDAPHHPLLLEVISEVQRGWNLAGKSA